MLGRDGGWRVDDERGSLLINPGRPISPYTMAIHHILDAEVATEPFWKEVASSVLRPEGGAIALAAHRAAFEQRYCMPRFTGGAAWILDMYVEMRTSSVASTAQVFQPDAPVSAYASGIGAHDRPSRQSRDLASQPSPNLMRLGAAPTYRAPAPRTWALGLRTITHLTTGSWQQCSTKWWINSVQRYCWTCTPLWRHPIVTFAWAILKVDRAKPIHSMRSMASASARVS